MSQLGAASGVPNTMLLALIFAVSAVIGYRMSVRHSAQRGVTPWRFPSIVWALICFAIGPLGIIVELFAGVTTRPAVSTEPRLDPRLDIASSHAEPRGQVELLEPQPVGLAPALAPPRAPDGSSPAPFGWYPDVMHRHEYRYFDGKYWSEQVADRGVISHDPL